MWFENKYLNIYLKVNKIKNIKDNFQEFLDYLSESYDSPVDITWIEKENLIDLFCVNDKVYQINCINNGDFNRYLV